MKNGIVLLYNCTDAKFFKLKQIFAMLKLRMRTVTPDKYHLTLAQLAEGAGEAGETVQAIPERMLVFCGMSEEFLHQVLEVLRVAKLPPIEFKAMMTETNSSWNSLELYEELKKERDGIAEHQAGN